MPPPLTHPKKKHGVCVCVSGEGGGGGGEGQFSGLMHQN